MTRTLTCAVCDAQGRVPPHATRWPLDSLRWLCGRHSDHTAALLAGCGA